MKGGLRFYPLGIAWMIKKNGCCTPECNRKIYATQDALEKASAKSINVNILGHVKLAFKAFGHQKSLVEELNLYFFATMRLW